MKIDETDTESKLRGKRVKGPMLPAPCCLWRISSVPAAMRFSIVNKKGEKEMNGKKLLCSAMALTLAAGLLAGCGGNNQTADVDVDSLEVLTENTMPISEEGVTLSIWLENQSQGYAKSYADMLAFDRLAEITGVTLEFQHPTGTTSEQLSIILASNSYPDMIYSNWQTSGLKQLKNGVCLDLAPYIEKLAPNLRALLEERPDLEEQLVWANGEIVMFPQVVDDQKFLCYDGYFIRQDWLDQVGESVPTTIDEWYTVLKKFKEADLNGNGEQDEIPFSSIKSMFSEAFTSAYGFSKYDYYLDPDSGKITHATLNPNFKEYLSTMNQWYSEGLINENFLNSTTTELDSLVLNDQLGSIYIDNNNDMPKYMQLNPDIELVAVPYPTWNGGKSYYPNNAIIQTLRGKGCMITTSCKNVVEAVRYCDYFYTQEASDIMNWGFEGESYTVNEDGTKQFTDLIQNNPEGKTPYEAICKYMTNTGFTGIIQYAASHELEANLSENIQKVKEDSVQYALDADKSLLVRPLKYTVEESDAKSTKESDISSYVTEMVGKFIIGTEPLRNYETFLETLKEMGIEDVIEIYQTAYDRQTSNQ